MKYIPADKLIAEVERLKPRLRKIGGKDVLVTTDSVYKKLNRIIDFARSLQQEQPSLPSNLGKKTFETICDILQEHFGLDELDLVEFAMEYEKLTGQQIPAEWLLLFPGATETIKVK